MSDQEFIKKFSQYKIDTVNSYFKSSSQDVRNGVVNRFRREQKQAIEQINQPTGGYSPETDKNLEAVSQNANGVNYLDKTTNQILTAQQAIEKYGQPTQAGVNPTTEGTTQQYTPSQKNLFE